MKWRMWLPVAVLLIAVLLFFSAKKERIRNISFLLPRHPSFKFSTRPVTDIRETIIHHTAGNPDDSIFGIARYHSTPGNHVCEEGCAGILYHIMIDRTGMIYLTQPLDRIIHHTKGRNSKTASICLIGNYNELELTPRIIRSIRYAIRYIERKSGNEQFVTAHRDHRSTSCPGNNVDVDQIINHQAA